MATHMICKTRSDDRIGALTLILLCFYWLWASAWQPYAFTARDLLAQASRITGGAIALQSGADLTLQAAQISGQRLSAQAGVINGQQVNPSAQLQLDAAINDRSQSQSSSGHDLLTQRTASQGTIEQALQYTTIAVPGAGQADGAVQLHATGGLTVGASSLTRASGNTAAASTGSGTTPTVTLGLRQQGLRLKCVSWSWVRCCLPTRRQRYAGCAA
ncbi:MAG: hypothetical protein KGJ65_08315 [Betaproteobacteria bacterium]|nr:hypothetical protein [Betaproteobacteria bacterium]